MTLSIWLLFLVIGVIHFIISLKKSCKKAKKLYVLLFIMYQVLFALAWMGKIPQHFTSIIKVW